jgi:multisubunit Na+/H+ antiporter MnhB subunit
MALGDGAVLFGATITLFLVASRIKQMRWRSSLQLGLTAQPSIEITAAARVFMEAAVSLAVLGSGLWIMVSNGYEAGDKQWATGALGAVLGYWLKGTGRR